MNLILAQVFTESKKANINMHERRIMEISEAKDVITRFILGWIPKILLAKFGNYSTHRPQKVCIIQEIEANRCFHFAPRSYWLLREHDEYNEICGPIIGEEIGEDFVDETIAMLKEKENDRGELMDVVRKFQDDTKKSLEQFLGEKEEEIAMEDNEMSFYEVRFNQIDSRLDKLESTLLNISSKLDKLVN